jgi:phenylalanyl-tRNA synthetase alpha chain
MPGKVYRNEAIDATHDMTFFQCEGMMVGKNVTLGNLKYVVETALSEIFKKPIKTRFRPGYFPFVEPGFELDLWNETGGKDKKGAWLEFMGCGMIHPKVLEHGGIDPKEHNGFAFGFGLTRLAMMRYKITDIRELFSGSQQFAKQF